MNFDRTEEQQLLAESIGRFIGKDYDFATRAKIVASRDGYSEDVWAAFAEIGLLGLPFSSDYGGFGGGAVDLMSVMEAIGDALVVEPYLSTVGQGAQFISRAGTSAQKKALLPAVVRGTLKMAFAQYEKTGRYNLAHVTTRARKSEGGYVIDGEKRVVIHAPCASMLVVSVRTSGGDADRDGISLFLVAANAPGITLRKYLTIDELRAADVVFDGVHVNADTLIGTEGSGLELIEEVTDYATALICAEAVGAIRCANGATLDYLKARQQFGVPIGAFQALQHRMVDMVISAEQAESMASLACAGVDSESNVSERKRIVSAAKIRIADACRHVSQEAIQLHGGMGMSDELKISHTFRRLTMIALQFGDADYHLERFTRGPK
jgi:alkylation response protein AidB-like acyl-CoA dehydrogenase